MCLCVCVCVCNIFIFVILFLYEPQFALLWIDIRFLRYTVLLPPLICADSSSAPALRQLALTAPICCCPPPYLFVCSARQLPSSLASGFLVSGGAYSCQRASSAITALSSIFGHWRMYASLYLLPWSRRVLDLTINSDI